MWEEEPRRPRPSLPRGRTPEPGTAWAREWRAAILCGGSRRSDGQWRRLHRLLPVQADGAFLRGECPRAYPSLSRSMSAPTALSFSSSRS